MKKFINPVRNKFLNGVKNNFIFILPVLSAILLILAQPPYDLEFLIWVALIPFFWFLGLKQISPKKALIGGYLFGLAFFGKLMTWLLATYPFEWLTVSAKEKIAPFIVLLGILFFIQIAFLAIFPAVFSWFIKKFLNFESINLFRLFAAAALWIFLEYLRAWGFGILWLGKESLLGPHWTFGNLAYALHNKLALIQIADIAGIYGISFLIVLINLILFLVIKHSRSQNFSAKHIIALFILMGLIGTVWTGYGIYQLKTEKNQPGPGLPALPAGRSQTKIALIQTQFLSGSEFNPYQKKEVFDAVIDLFKSPESIQANPDFIIAPEGFGVVSLTGDKEIAKYLLKDFWQSGQIYLENQKISDENKKIKSRLFYYDLEKETPLAYHDKMLLVPNGDFLPYITKFILSLYSFDIKYEQKFFNRGEKTNQPQLPRE